MARVHEVPGMDIPHVLATCMRKKSEPTQCNLGNKTPLTTHAMASLTATEMQWIAKAEVGQYISLLQGDKSHRRDIHYRFSMPLHTFF